MATNRFFVDTKESGSKAASMEEERSYSAMEQHGKGHLSTMW